MSLKEQIRLEEEQLKKLGGDPGPAIDEDDDAVESGKETTPPAKKTTQKATDDENVDDGDDDDGDEDEAPGKKAPKSAKKGKDDDADDADDDADDADKGEKGKKSAKKGEEDDENSTAAQLRIERKQRKQLEQRLEQLLAGGVKQPALKVAEKPAGEAGEGDQGQPKKETADERLDRIEREREQTKLMSDAVEEFNTYEKEFQAETPDYAQASNHVIQVMAQSVRALYPNATDAQVGTFIRQQILHLAGQAVTKGLNPAEALYLMAHERFGYKKAAAPAPKAKTDDAAKRLETVSKNKKRSASPLAGGGQQGSASSTLEEAANMSLADFSKLKPGEIEALISEAQDM